MVTTTHGARLLDVRSERMVVAVLIAALFAVIAPRVRETARKSDEAQALLAPVETVVHGGTFAIDSSALRTTRSRVVVEGRTLSTAPPLLTVAMAGTYAALHAVLGVDLRTDRNHNSAHRLLAFLFSGGSLLLMLLFGFRLACRLAEGTGARLFVVAAMGFGFFGAGYAADVNVHLPVAAVLLFALDTTARLRTDPRATRASTHALGVALGLLPALDLTSGLWSVALVALLFRHERPRVVRWLLPALAVVLAVHVVLMLSITGSVVPVALRLDDPEQAFSATDRALYAWHMLFGGLGVVPMVPSLLPATVGLLRAWRGRAGRVAAELAWAAVPAVAATVAVYAFGTHAAGEEQNGFRWLIPTVAGCLPFAAVAVDGLGQVWSRRATFGLAVAIGLGTPHMTAAVTKGPWAPTVWESLVERWGDALFSEAPVHDDRRHERI